MGVVEWVRSVANADLRSGAVASRHVDEFTELHPRGWDDVLTLFDFAVGEADRIGPPYTVALAVPLPETSQVTAVLDPQRLPDLRSFREPPSLYVFAELPDYNPDEHSITSVANPFELVRQELTFELVSWRSSEAATHGWPVTNTLWLRRQ